MSFQSRDRFHQIAVNPKGTMSTDTSSLQVAFHSCNSLCMIIQDFTPFIESLFKYFMLFCNKPIFTISFTIDSLQLFGRFTVHQFSSLFSHICKTNLFSYSASLSAGLNINSHKEAAEMVRGGKSRSIFKSLKGGKDVAWLISLC